MIVHDGLGQTAIEKLLRQSVERQIGPGESQDDFFKRAEEFIKRDESSETFFRQASEDEAAARQARAETTKQALATAESSLTTILIIGGVITLAVIGGIIFLIKG